MLPLIIDHLTPHGQVPAQSALEQGIAALRNGLFKS
jgi:uncharacterized protein YidB (DUF937 family)